MKEDLIMELIDRMEVHHEIQSTHLHNLETQVARLASALQETNQEGLPVAIENTPTQHVIAIEFEDDNALVKHPPTKVHKEIEREKCEDVELEAPISKPLTCPKSVNDKSEEKFGITVLYEEFNKSFDYKDPFLEGFDSEYDGNNTKYMKMLHTPHVHYFRVQAYFISHELYLKEPTRKKREKMLPRRLPHVRLYF